jgi:hypothetical protein
MPGNRLRIPWHAPSNLRRAGEPHFQELFTHRYYQNFYQSRAIAVIGKPVSSLFSEAYYPWISILGRTTLQQTASTNTTSAGYIIGSSRATLED